MMVLFAGKKTNSEWNTNFVIQPVQTDLVCICNPFALMKYAVVVDSIYRAAGTYVCLHRMFP